jgi:hypothetical protein
LERPLRTSPGTPPDAPLDGAWEAPLGEGPAAAGGLVDTLAEDPRWEALRLADLAERAAGAHAAPPAPRPRPLRDQPAGLLGRAHRRAQRGLPRQAPAHQRPVLALGRAGGRAAGRPARGCPRPTRRARGSSATWPSPGKPARARPRPGGSTRRPRHAPRGARDAAPPGLRPRDRRGCRAHGGLEREVLAALGVADPYAPGAQAASGPEPDPRA